MMAWTRMYVLPAAEDGTLHLLVYKVDVDASVGTAMASMELSQTQTVSTGVLGCPLRLVEGRGEMKSFTLVRKTRIKHNPGADPRGGGGLVGVLGVRTLPPFWGPPNFIKRDRNVACVCTTMPRFRTPLLPLTVTRTPSLSEILYLLLPSNLLFVCCSTSSRVIALLQ